MTILVYILIAVFGFYCFQSLPLALMPEMELPVAIVYSTYAGAGPEDIEQQVTEPLESACASLSGLESLTSTSAENMSMVIAQFDYGVNLDEVLTDMRDNVDMVKSQLPEDASDPDGHVDRYRFHAGHHGGAARQRPCHHAVDCRG